MHQLPKACRFGIAALVSLFQQALLGWSQTRGGQWIVQLCGGCTFLVELFEPPRVAQYILGQHAHGRMEGTHAAPRLGRIESEIPEAQHLEQLFAQLHAGGVGEGNHRQPFGRDFHMTEHEYHPQHQGGGLARACASEDSGDRAVAEDHGPLFVGRRTDHTGLHRLAYAQAHRLDLRVIDCHPGRPVDALASWFTGLGTWFRRFSRRPRLRFPDGLDALLRVRHGPAPKQYRTLLRTQMGGCARETTRQRSGNEQFVALDGRKHDDQPNIEYVVDMVRVFVAWLGAGVLIWDSRAITGDRHG